MNVIGNVLIDELTVDFLYPQVPNFTYLSNTVETIDLSKNNIAMINSSFFDNLGKLKLMWLNSNNLNTIETISGIEKHLIVSTDKRNMEIIFHLKLFVVTYET